MFERFDAGPADAGFAVAKGGVVDASIVESPKQRDTPENNAQIKADKRPASLGEKP